MAHAISSLQNPTLYASLTWQEKKRLWRKVFLQGTDSLTSFSGLLGNLPQIPKQPQLISSCSERRLTSWSLSELQSNPSVRTLLLLLKSHREQFEQIVGKFEEKPKEISRTCHSLWLCWGILALIKNTPSDPQEIEEKELKELVHILKYPDSQKWEEIPSVVEKYLLRFADYSCTGTIPVRKIVRVVDPLLQTPLRGKKGFYIVYDKNWIEKRLQNRGSIPYWPLKEPPSKASLQSWHEVQLKIDRELEDCAQMLLTTYQTLEQAIQSL